MRLPVIPRAHLWRRRLQYSSVTAVTCAVVLWYFARLDDQGIHSSWRSGYLLAAIVLFLAAFNLRKKITVLPRLGSAASWMQAHIYVGLSSFVIFAAHVQWRLPDGNFERLLAGVFLAVGFSGVYGLYLTRIMPRRLTAIKQQVIFEQIPQKKYQLALSARKLLLENPQPNEILARFYVNKVSRFLEQPRNLIFWLVPSARYCKRLLTEIRGLDRYLAMTERETSQSLMQLVREKDDLDYHHAVQGQLKCWLFVHIALTYSLLSLGTLHGVIVHAFGGGLR